MLTKLLLMFGILFLVPSIRTETILTIEVEPFIKNGSQEQRANVIYDPFYRKDSNDDRPKIPTCCKADVFEAMCNEKVAPIMQNLVRIGGNVYYVAPPITTTTPGLNWYQAQDFCRRYGMQLLSVETTTEDTLIKNYINTLSGSTKKFWTGLNDLTTEGSYYWIGNGQTAWQTMPGAAPTPSGDTADCGQLMLQSSAIIWDDQLCSDVTRFICEMDCPCDSFISVV